MTRLKVWLAPHSSVPTHTCLLAYDLDDPEVAEELTERDRVGFWDTFGESRERFEQLGVILDETIDEENREFSIELRENMNTSVEHLWRLLHMKLRLPVKQAWIEDEDEEEGWRAIRE